MWNTSCGQEAALRTGRLAEAPESRFRVSCRETAACQVHAGASLRLRAACFSHGAERRSVKQSESEFREGERGADAEREGAEDLPAKAEELARRRVLAVSLFTLFSGSFALGTSSAKDARRPMRFPDGKRLRAGAPHVLIAFRQASEC